MIAMAMLIKGIASSTLMMHRERLLVTVRLFRIHETDVH